MGEVENAQMKKVGGVTEYELYLHAVLILSQVEASFGQCEPLLIYLNHTHTDTHSNSFLPGM